MRMKTRIEKIERDIQTLRDCLVISRPDGGVELDAWGYPHRTYAKETVTNLLMMLLRYLELEIDFVPASKRMFKLVPKKKPIKRNKKNT